MSILGLHNIRKTICDMQYVISVLNDAAAMRFAINTEIPNKTVSVPFLLWVCC